MAKVAGACKVSQSTCCTSEEIKQEDAMEDGVEHTCLCE
jgi:hypothetical protein